MKQEEIKQRAYDVYNTWLYSCNDQRESFELMADFATELVAEAEEAAFKAGWYMGCQLNDCDMKKCEKMFKGWRENK
jgi:hypothetical protein